MLPVVTGVAEEVVALGTLLMWAVMAKVVMADQVDQVQ
jgi:hypothetical protein